MAGTKRLILTALFCSLIFQVCAQQDPLYNLYGFNQYMINPGYAGIYNNFNANLITRKQWTGLEGSPLTNLFAAHTALTDKFGSGLLLINDQLGINSNTEGQLSFSYKLFSGASTLAFGLQGGFINYRYDYSKLNLAFTDDEGLDMTNDNFTKANFGAGLFYMNDKFYLGLSVPRILNVKVNNENQKSTRYQPHYYLSGGFIIQSKSVNSLLFKPTFLLRYSNNQLSTDLSINALLANTVWLGTTVRNLKGIAFTTQIQIDRKYRLGYSFELASHQLAGNGFNTHELSLMVDLNLFKDHYDIERYF